MTLLYVIGGVISVGLLVYLFVALLTPETLLMTANGFFQIALYVVVLTALAKPLGSYMARVFDGRADASSTGCSDPSSASSTASPASIPSRG